MKNLREIGIAFFKIEQSKGTNKKKEIIKQTLESSLLKDDFELCLRHLYDPMVVTGISKTSWLSAYEETKDYSDEHLDEFPDIKSFLDFLHKNNSGKRETVITCLEIYQHYCCLFNQEVKKLLYWLVTKDINIGISTTTIRKFIDIPKFEIMLGSRLEDDVDFEREFYLTQKLDGINLTCIKRGNDIKFITRQGKFVEGLDNLLKDYQSMEDGVYCGEAIYDGESSDRKHLYRLSAGEIGKKESNKQINHHLFDYQTLEEWDSNNFITPFSFTYNNIQKQLENKKPKHIFLVEKVYQGTGKEIAFSNLKEAKDKGWEGLMLRYSSSVYEKTRSKNLIKLKLFYDMDLRIIGYKEFKHPNLLGAFIVDYKGYEVSVGSGFSKEDRENFWKNKESMIGKIIEIQYMEETQNKEGKLSLRFPVFIRVRDDKDEVSYS